ncbi:MAG: site-specific integrase [Acidobacteria bacterium]|nr:site-specific integrase [Acidobacteriota bacterium]
MGSLYRPTYRDKKTNALKHSKVWWVSIYSCGKQFMINTHQKDRAEAKRFLQQREGDLGNGVPFIKNQHKIIFEELAQDVLTDYEINKKRSLGDAKTRYKKHILPFFGNLKVTSITTTGIRTYTKKRLDEGAANGTVNRELTLVKRAFNLAKREGRIHSVPYFPMLKEAGARKGFFEPEQFQAVHNHLPEYLKTVARFGYETGWRKNEILTLQWPQVDFEGRCVRLLTSKNSEGRVFPFTPDLEEVLLEQRAKADKLKQGGIICPWVFHHTFRGKKGQRITSFKRSWKTACKDAGVPGRVFHDLRRTAVRNLERAGVPRSVAMKLTGHKTENIYRRYDIVSENDMQIAAERLGAHTGKHLKLLKVSGDFGKKSKIAKMPKAANDSFKKD